MATEKGSNVRPVNRKGWFKPYIASTWQLYAMMLIPIIYILCFKYKPMIGIVMAFKKYTPFGGRSMWEMDWVGFQWFTEAFGEPTTPPRGDYTTPEELTAHLSDGKHYAAAAWEGETKGLALMIRPGGEGLSVLVEMKWLELMPGFAAAQQG